MIPNDIIEYRINEEFKPNTIWRIWAKALGEKASHCDRESDRVAIIRTIIAGINLATCIFIVVGILRHW